MPNLVTLPNVDTGSSNALALNHDCLRTINTTSASGGAKTTAAASYDGVVVLRGFKRHVESEERAAEQECLFVAHNDIVAEHLWGPECTGKAV